ncbi:MAG: VOC family protein [Proteobacteria bacterium]|nr:VOC family protein [Pseudomonadota bacterium]
MKNCHANAGADRERQLPIGDEIFLDHAGHFVADPQAAADALMRAGFSPAPRSIQVAPDAAGNPAPTGTGNVTAMFARGYIEVLFKTADTPLGREFDAALQHHRGVHLAAFAVADADAAQRRLQSARFRVRPLANFQRPVATPTGEAVARFSVARVERGEMAEGRVQILAHHSEDAVWQKRWLGHANGALGLYDLVIACPDVDEAATRFTRFTARAAYASRYGRTIGLDRGRVELMSQAAFSTLFADITVPGLPFMGAYAIAVHDLAAAERVLARGGLRPRALAGCIAAAFPPALGVGAWVFADDLGKLPWRIPVR